MIYVSITPRSWLFSHLGNNFGLAQVLIKTGISSQDKEDTSRPSALYPICDKITLPDERSSELLKHTIQKIYPECTAGLSYSGWARGFHPKLTQLIWDSEISEETETHFIAGRWRAGITIIWRYSAFGLKATHMIQRCLTNNDTRTEQTHNRKVKWQHDNRTPCSFTNKS